MSVGVALGTKRLRAVQIAVVLLLLIVIYSVVKRFVIDMPNLAAGTLPARKPGGGPDAICAPLPQPVPESAASASAAATRGHTDLRERLARLIR